MTMRAVEPEEPVGTIPHRAPTQQAATPPPRSYAPPRGGAATHDSARGDNPFVSFVNREEARTAASAASAGNWLENLRTQTQRGLAETANNASLAPDERMLLTEAGISILERLNAFDESGRLDMGDGSFISMDDVNNPDPLIRAQALAALYDFGGQILGDGNAFLESVGLPAFDIEGTLPGPAAEHARQAAQEAFQNAMARYNASIAYDELNIGQAAERIARQVQGLEQSRARANTVTQSLLDAAPWATGGQTQFSGADLGGGVSLLLNQAGIANPANMSLLDYPTSVQIDPAALMAQGDAALGVQGPLPEIPGLLTQPGMIPAAPPLVLVPSGVVPRRDQPQGRNAGLVEIPGQEGAY